MGLSGLFGKKKKPKSVWDELMENPDMKLMVEVKDYKMKFAYDSKEILGNDKPALIKYLKVKKQLIQ